MSNPYTEVSVSGYNLSPPPDDGSQVAANQLGWDKHKTKLGDPLKTAIETLNTNVNAAFATVDDASNLTTGTLPDARLSFDVAQLALKDASNTFTGTTQTFEASAPRLLLHETDASTNSGEWRLVATGDNLFLQARADGDGSGENVWQVTRTATNVDTFAVTADTITLNGVDVSGYARLSQANIFTSSGFRDDAALQIRTASAAELYLRVSGADTDEKGISIRQLDSGAFTIGTATDSHGFGENFLRVDRDGSSVDTINFENGELQYGGTEVGYRSVPANSENGNYTLVEADRGLAVYKSSGGSGETITVPSGVFSQGDVVTIVNWGGGTLTIEQGSGMTMRLSGVGTSGNRTLADTGVVTIWFASGSASLISGSGLS